MFTRVTEYTFFLILTMTIFDNSMTYACSSMGRVDELSLLRFDEKTCNKEGSDLSEENQDSDAPKDREQEIKDEFLAGIGNPEKEKKSESQKPKRKRPSMGGFSIAADEKLLNSHIYYNSSKSKLKKRKVRDRRRIFTHDQDNNPVTDDEGKTIPEIDIITGGYVEPADVTPDTEPISESVIELSHYFDRVSDSNIIANNTFEGLKSGDWQDFKLSKEQVALGITGTMVLGIYKFAKNLTPAGLSLSFLFGTTGAYADFQTEYKDNPILIFNITDREELRFLLSNDEIRLNTLAMLNYAEVQLCTIEVIEGSLEEEYCSAEE